jgi:hypothetical protein
MKAKWILKGFGILVLVVLFVAAVGYGTMYLWNWLVPDLFHGPTITLVQTYGLLLLSKILFGGFHGKGRWRHHEGGPRGYWKSKMRAKWQNMSPDERQKLREKFRRHCRDWDNDWDEPTETEQPNSKEPQA